MGEPDGEWRRIEAELARDRRRLARAARRTESRLTAVAAPDPVPAPDARRLGRRRACGVWAAWAAVVLADAILIRTHLLSGAFTGISAPAGAVAGFLLVGVHHGWAERPSLTMREGQHLMSARTLTGVRTLDLDALVSVRRFETVWRPGPFLDEFHLRDRHGVRLAVGNEPAVNAALRRAVAPPDSRLGSRPDPRPDRDDGPGHDGPAAVRVTRHARTALGMAPRSRIPRALHRFWGFWLAAATMGLPALLSYVAAGVLAGTDSLG